MGDTRAIHCSDDSIYPDASTYKVNQFLTGDLRVPSNLSWGAGEHIVRMLPSRADFKLMIAVQGEILGSTCHEDLVDHAP